MKTPLIFLAFANDPDAHLQLLKEESRQLFQALEELDRKEYIKVYREESAQAKDIFDGFTRYKDRVAIFHYAGHANGTHLRLESGAGDARGLAQLMGEQENLKLVFLNGCSSKGQVETLFAAGVKAVIATSVKIEDDKAMAFARQFYQAMAHRRTIGQAFSLAQAYLETHYGDRVAVNLRDFVFEDLEALTEGKDAVEFPWGLYIKAEHREEILHWKLPYYRPVSLPKEIMQGISRQFPANKYILQVLDDMGQFHPDIYHRMVEQRGEETEKVDTSAYPQLIISSFPWPIGSQIRILFVDEWREFGTQRIKQLLSTYIISSQVLYSILLSDFWEQVRQGQIPVPEDLHLQLPENKQAFLAKDWLSEMDVIYRRMMDHGAMPFVPEYELVAERWQDPENPLRKAHTYLEKLRARINDLPKADLDKLCLQVEKAVALVLKQAAFLARYRMLTVRDITVDKPRCQELVYDLDMGYLSNSDGNFLSLYQDAEKRRKSVYGNSRAIILVHDEDHLNESLDLSPFIIDRNTFVSTLQGGTSQDSTAKLYLAGWGQDNKLHYYSVDPSLFTALDEPLYQVHSDMTQADFDEGKNSGTAGQTPEDDWLDADFGDVFEEEPAPEETVEGPKVFALLQRQYDTFVADLKIPVKSKPHA